MHEAEIARLEAEIGALQEQEERHTRIEQMTVNIEKMRKEMAQANRTFTMQIIGALIAAAAAGAAIMKYFSP